MSRDPSSAEHRISVLEADVQALREQLRLALAAHEAQREVLHRIAHPNWGTKPTAQDALDMVAAARDALGEP